MENGEQEHQVPTEKVVGWVENSNNFKNESQGSDMVKWQVEQ